jgi:hypothetical protein
MRSHLLFAGVGGLALVLLFGGPTAAHARHFRIRHAGYRVVYPSYGAYAPVGYWSYYQPFPVTPQRDVVETKESEPGVVRAAYTTTQPQIPPAVIPFQLSEPRVLPFSAMGSDRFPSPIAMAR